MPNTTNYNWATPADTDLVKDGAAAIRTLGSSADTTVKNLNPGTTAGDIDYYTSSTAKARIAIGTAGQVLKVNSGGTAPEWGTTADQTPLTTKGDLFTFDTADARLGVGANGTVLTADSAETTGLKWAAPSAAGANWTLLNSGGTSLTGATTTVSGISGKNQILVLITQVSGASSGATVRVRLNGDTGNNYYNIGKSLYFNSTYSASMSEQRTATISYVEFGQMANNAASNISGYVWFDGCNSSGVKTYHKQMGIDTGGGNALRYTDGGGYWDNSATVTEVNISMDTGNLDGGTVFIYTSAV